MTAVAGDGEINEGTRRAAQQSGFDDADATANVVERAEPRRTVSALEPVLAARDVFRLPRRRGVEEAVQLPRRAPPDQ